jgi:hypothetical protein
MNSSISNQLSITALPSNFQFSQGSLQAFADCPRLFQLRYIYRLSWPAPEVEPVKKNERFMQLGSDFHRLVQQFFLGVPSERLEQIAAQDDRLAQWWRDFQDNRPDLSGYAQHKETSLSCSIGENRLVGKFDMIAVPIKTSNQDKVKIFDWKTSRGKNPPKREWQKKKLQTRVYPYLLVKAGTQLNNGKPFDPDQIEMTYWFSNFPTSPMQFSYSKNQFDEDEKFITGLIEGIETIGEEDAPKTENEKRCQFCIYRSLCNRGVKAGNFDEIEDDLGDVDDFDFNLDFEQIAEIEF